MSCYAVVNAMLHPDLKPNEARLFAYLTFRANGERVTWPSVPEMEEQCHMERATVLRATKRLAELGLIKIHRRPRDCNLYEILVVDEARPNFAPAPQRARRPKRQEQNVPTEQVAECPPPEPIEPPVAEVAEYAQQNPAGSQNVHLIGRKMHTSVVAKCQPESSNKYPTLSNKVRCFAAAAPSASSPPPPPAVLSDPAPIVDPLPERYWNGDGRRIVRKLTGCSHAEAGKMLGKFRHVASGNLSAVLDTLMAAERDATPGHALWGYVTNGVQARLAPKPVFSTPAGRIADAMGLNDPKRRRDFWGNWGDEPAVDYSDFEGEALGNAR